MQAGEKTIQAPSQPRAALLCVGGRRPLRVAHVRYPPQHADAQRRVPGRTSEQPRHRLLLDGHRGEEVRAPRVEERRMAARGEFPYPLIRMADLYLSYAEAYNEYYGPDQKAYDKINAVRRRAGLRDVEDVWNDSSIVSEVGKHRTQDGLRDIIHTERMIEALVRGTALLGHLPLEARRGVLHHPHSGLVRSRRQHFRRLLRAHHMAAARVDDPQELSAPDPRRRDQQEPQGGPEPGLLICLT